MSVRLLLDENLSEALLPKLEAVFDGSAHVRQLLGEGHSDRAVWNAALDGGFILVTLDGDFERVSVLEGAPPKVVWIDCHNPSNRQIAELLRSKAARIVGFSAESDSAFLALRTI
jgi:predicted nuclease of predicted toxin-antitoxin system